MNYDAAKAAPEHAIVSLAQEYAEVSQRIGQLQEQVRQSNMELKKLLDAQQGLRHRIIGIVDPVEEAPRRAGEFLDVDPGALGRRV